MSTLLKVLYNKRFDYKRFNYPFSGSNGNFSSPSQFLGFNDSQKSDGKQKRRGGVGGGAQPFTPTTEPARLLNTALATR